MKSFYKNGYLAAIILLIGVSQVSGMEADAPFRKQAITVNISNQSPYLLALFTDSRPASNPIIVEGGKNLNSLTLNPDKSIFISSAQGIYKLINEPAHSSNSYCLQLFNLNRAHISYYNVLSAPEDATNVLVMINPKGEISFVTKSESSVSVGLELPVNLSGITARQILCLGGRTSKADAIKKVKELSKVFHPDKFDQNSQILARYGILSPDQTQKIMSKINDAKSLLNNEK